MARPSKSESPGMSPVRLKPILGISPERYLPVVLAALLLAALFALLLLPGLLNFGSLVTFRSHPASAEVVIDGVRRGATPVTTFVSAGERELSVRYPGFEEERTTVEVRGRLFASVILPRKMVIESRLPPRAPDSLARDRSREFARWALTGSGSAAFPAPPILAETARALASFPEDPESREALSQLLVSAHHHLATPTQLKDLSRATLLAEGAGVVSPLAVGRSVLEIIQHVKSSQDAAAVAALLDRALPATLMEEYRGQAWYAENGDRSVAQTLDPSSSDLELTLPRRVTVAGMRFIEVPGTDGRLLMLEREVTRDDYAAFLEEVPRWRGENRSDLAASGLVNEDYLADWFSPAEGDEPLRFVSWHAATAFASWLDGRLAEIDPALAEVYRFRLPRAQEWRAAVAGEPQLAEDGSLERITFESEGERPYPVAPERRSEAGFYDLYGNLWEWHQEFYAPAPEAEVLYGPPLVGAERVVLGGSFANGRREISPEATGSQPPDWASAYLGFRLVLAPREGVR